MEIKHPERAKKYITARTVEVPNTKQRNKDRSSKGFE